MGIGVGDVGIGVGCVGIGVGDVGCGDRGEGLAHLPSVLLCYLLRVPLIVSILSLSIRTGSLTATSFIARTSVWWLVHMCSSDPVSYKMKVKNHKKYHLLVMNTEIPQK